MCDFFYFFFFFFNLKDITKDVFLSNVEEVYKLHNLKKSREGRTTVVRK